jgi:hypothetical protein
MNKTITRFKKIFLMLALLLWSGNQVQAQLAAGDILFTGFDSRGTDTFSFILLKELSNNVTINFTDRGYGGSSYNADVNNAENSISWSSGYSTLPVGTEIVITGLTAKLAGSGSVVGTVTALTGTAGLALGSIDQIIAYTGVLNTNATAIAGIHWGNCGGATTTATWDPTGCISVASATGSTMPPGLSNANGAMWTGLKNGSTPLGAVLNTPGTAYTTIAALRAGILNNANWTLASGTDALTIGVGSTFYQAPPPPSIYTSPTSVTVCSGYNTSFSTTAGNQTSIKWQVKIGSSEFTDLTNSGIYTGANTSTLNLSGVPASANGYQYRAVATNVTGSVNSASATLSVVDGAPIFSTHPANATSCNSGTTLLTAGATGGSITYKWQVNTGSGYADIADGGVYAQSSTTTLTISNTTTSMHGYRYRLAAINLCGTTYSNESTLSIGNSWTGAINTNWNNAANWACNTVPTTETDVIINATTNTPNITAAAGARNISIGTNAILIIGNNQTLSITGDVHALGLLLAANMGATVEFNSSTEQVIPSGNYYNLSATGGGNKSLAGDVTVMNTTAFANSTKILIGNNTFTLGHTGNVSGGSATGYFVTNGTGGLKKLAVGATDFVFPIGSLTNYSPFSIANSGTLDNFTGRVTDNVYANYSDGTPQGSPLTSRAVANTWFVTEEVPGGSNATLTMQWNQSAERTGFKRTSSSILQFTSAWNAYKPSRSSDPDGAGPHTISRSGLTSFGPFGVFSSASIESVNASTANGIYKAGDIIAIQVKFSEEVTVTGTPQLQLETGTTDHNALYKSGSGTTSLTFEYTVQAGDFSGDLDYISTTSLLLNAGSITDITGADAALSLPTPGATGSLSENKNIIIDGQAPTVTISSTAGVSGSTTATTPIPFTITFSESVTGFSTGSITVTNGTLDAVSGSGNTYTVSVSPRTAGSETTLRVLANAVYDAAGNGNVTSSTYAITFEDKLPVSLVAFTGQPVGNTVRLAWTTASENNNKSYTVYRSSDAREFFPIAVIDGGGTTQVRKDYVFVDHEPLAGISYYKLRQTDYNDVFVDFRIKSVDLGLSNISEVSVSPNPTTSNISVKFSGSVNKFELIDLSGRIITNSIVRPDEDTYTINVESVPSGTYFIRLIGERSVKLLRFLKI